MSVDGSSVDSVAHGTCKHLLLIIIVVREAIMV